MKLFACIILGFCCFSGYAQMTDPSFPEENIIDRYMSDYTLRQNPSMTKAKPTAIQQRLIGSVDNYGDSLYFQYTGINGSRFDYDMLEYGTGWGNSIDYSKKDVSADLVQQYSPNLVGVLTLAKTIQSTMNASGSVTYQDEMSFIHSPNQRTTTYNQYDPNGWVTEWLTLDNLGGPYDSTRKGVLQRDAQGRIVKLTTYQYTFQQIWDPRLEVSNYYSANGYVDSTVTLQYNGAQWTSYHRTVHEYYPNNFLKKTLHYLNNGVTLKDSFEYSGTAIYFTKMTHSFDNGAGWVIGEEIRRTLNAQNIPDTAYYYLNNNPQWDYKRVAYYNSYDNPDSVMVYVPSGALYINMSKHYYYETYNTVGTHDLSISKVDMQLYPNPAGNEINLYWKEARSERVTVDCMNGLGQKLFSQSLLWKDQRQKLSMAGLAPGLYWICVRNEQGGVIFTGQVVKG